MIANPHLITERNYRSLSRAAARFVGRQVLLKEDSVLGVPTGETPRGMYEELVKLCLKGVLDFSSVTLFNLDEYLGLPPEHPASFRSYMAKHFWEPLRLKETQSHIPHSSPTDPQQECHRYEAAIGKVGGLDLVVLGLGTNGHIAFNEPGTPWGLGTHVVELLPETRRREAAEFGGVENVPQRAITVGIKTIMRSRSVLLLASGAHKAEALARAFAGPVTPDVPASVLQLHPQVTVLADEEASRGLRERIVL